MSAPLYILLAYNSNLIEAIMVTGGYNLKSSEVLHFNGTSMCTLPPMPAVNRGHSQSASTVCGGETMGVAGSKTCYTFRDGRWETLNDHLNFTYYDHLSWMNENGDILLLGRGDTFESSHPFYLGGERVIIEIFFKGIGQTSPLGLV